MADNPGANVNSTPETESGGWTIQRILIVAAAVSVGAIAGIFLLGLVIALTSGEQSNERLEYFRDIFITILALQGIIVSSAIVVFVAQVARFINLLTTEFRVILENMQNTVKEAQASVEFVSTNTIGPILRISAFFAGLAAFFSELANIRRAIRPIRKATDESK